MSLKEETFTFWNPVETVDGDLRLILVEKRFGNPARGVVPAYKFAMRKVDTEEPIGRVDLRIGNTEQIVLYAGHIGYRVEPPYRGQRYAARSCLLLFDLARRHQIDPLWITCNPENVASKRTCELVGGKFIEIVELPEDTDMYREGERLKCRYRVDLWPIPGREA